MSYGIVPATIQGNWDDTITYGQYCTMVGSMLSLKGDAYAVQWQTTAELALASDTPMQRQDGMLALFYGAKTLGVDSGSGDWWKLNETIGAPWGDFRWNYPLFPDWSVEGQKVTYSNQEWNDHMTAAYFFSMDILSKENDKLVFDYDAEHNTMNPVGDFTRRDAVHSVLRFYESLAQPQERNPTQWDADFLAQADTRKQAILNSPSEYSISGTTYYVSNSGNDLKDGLTPDTAWATIARMNLQNLQPGDGVLFERGGIYRGVFKYRPDGITYSAYGTGPKPKIYGSQENGVDPAKWTLLEGTTNIWVYYKVMYDVAGIVFDDNARVALRQTALWDGTQYVQVTDHSVPFGLDDVRSMPDLHFSSLPDFTGLTPQQATCELDREGPLYLRCDAGNPGTVYESIEFMCKPSTPANGGWPVLVQVGTNCVVDNLSIMYSNECGILASSHSIVSNCEVSFCGGSQTDYYGGRLGAPQVALIRGGDGIVIGGADGATVRDSYIHNIYDLAITTETATPPDGEAHATKNIVIKGNLVEDCSGAISIADFIATANKDSSLVSFSDITVEDNYFLYSGYGWSHQEPDYDWGTEGPVNNGNATLMFSYPADTATNILFRNNVFYLGKYALINGTWGHENPADCGLIFSGNTYVQNKYSLFAQWRPTLTDSDNTQIWNQRAGEVVRGFLGDAAATVILPD